MSSLSPYMTPCCFIPFNSPTYYSSRKSYCNRFRSPQQLMFLLKDRPLYAYNNNQPDQNKDDDPLLKNSDSMEALYKLAMEEDEEWFNTFIKDSLFEERRNQQGHTASQLPDGIVKETTRIEDRVDKRWSDNPSTVNTSSDGTKFHNTNLPISTITMEGTTISKETPYNREITSTTTTNSPITRNKSLLKDDVASISGKESVIKGRDDDDDNNSPYKESSFHERSKDERVQKSKANVPTHTKESFVKDIDERVNIPIQNKESSVKEIDQGTEVSKVNIPKQNKDSIRKDMDDQQTDVNKVNIPIPKRVSIEKEMMDKKEAKDNTDLIVEFRDVYDPTQWVRESFTRFQYLGYEPKDILSLHPNALDFILEDNIPKPEKGLPKRWLIQSKDSNLKQPQVRILKRRKKKNITTDDDEDEEEEEDESTRTRNTLRNEEEASRKKTVYPREDEDEEDDDDKFTSDSKKRRERTIPKVRQMNVDNVLSPTTRKNNFWMDLPTFKKYLRKEAQLRLSILGSDWKEWVRDESDWRYQLYKTWLDVLDGGIGDDIFEDVPSSAKSKYIRTTYRKRDTTSRSASTRVDREKRYRDSWEDDKRNKQEKDTIASSRQKEKADDDNDDDDVKSSKRIPNDYNDDDDTFRDFDNIDDEYIQPKRRRRNPRSSRRSREDI